MPVPSGRPLCGRRVVVTREANRALELAAALETAAAEVALLPLIEIGPPDDPGALERAADDLGRWDWLVFTSVHAVDAFLPLVGGHLPAGLATAVVGPATAEALRGFGVGVAVVAREPRAEGLLRRLAPRVAARRVLIPQAADARPVLAEGLRAAGAEVATVAAYDKRLPAEAAAGADELFGASEIGLVTVTSPRIARHLSSLLGDDWPRRRRELRAISIGPVTSAELRRLGVEPAAEAEQPGVQGLVVAAERAAAGRASSRRPGGW